MKKEYIIPGLLIVLLSAYLVMHNQNKDNYTLPFIPEITVSDVTGIVIEKDGEILSLAKRDEAWVVTDKEYPADQSSVSKMLDIIKDLKVTAVVSEESALLNRYELDPENRIAIAVKSKVETLRKFEIGKVASSYRHTFIRLDGSKAVYHAAKSFRRDFEKSVDDLRSKEVLAFDKAIIKGVTLESATAGVVGELVLEASAPATPVMDTGDDTSASDATASSNSEPVKVWKFKQLADDGSITTTELKATDALTAMLSTLSTLKCSKFASTDSKEEAFKGMDKAVVITLKGDKDKSYSLELFMKDGEENYPAISSGNAYPFLLDTYQGENLLKKVNEVLGVEEKKEGGSEKMAGSLENAGGQMMDSMAQQVIEEAVQTGADGD